MASQGHPAQGCPSKCGAFSSWHSDYYYSSLSQMPPTKVGKGSPHQFCCLCQPLLPAYYVIRPHTSRTLALLLYPPDPLGVTAHRAFPAAGITKACGQNHRLPHSPPGFPTPISWAMGPARPRLSTMCPPSFDQLRLQVQSPQGDSDWMSLVNEHLL